MRIDDLAKLLAERSRDAAEKLAAYEQARDELHEATMEAWAAGWRPATISELTGAPCEHPAGTRPGRRAPAGPHRAAVKGRAGRLNAALLEVEAFAGQGGNRVVGFGPDFQWLSGEHLGFVLGERAPYRLGAMR